jgi:hypothetical protein
LNLAGEYHDLFPSHPSIYTHYSHSLLKVDKAMEDTVKGKMRKETVKEGRRRRESVTTFVSLK